MAFGMHMKLETDISQFTVDLSKFLDDFGGSGTVHVDPGHAHECDCNCDVALGRERFWAYCRFMNYPTDPAPGLKLTLTLKV